MPPRFRLTSPQIKLAEKHVRDQCITLLNLRHYWTRRLNTGRFKTLDGRWHTEGRKGDPDFVVLHEFYPGFLLEFKKAGEFLSPDQQQRHLEITLGYQITIVIADNLEQLECWLNQYEKQYENRLQLWKA